MAITPEQMSTLQRLHNEAVSKARLLAAMQMTAAYSDRARAQVLEDRNKAEAALSDYLLGLCKDD